jgi:hypothetical protein
MTPHQTLAVVVRLFAMWFAIYVARELLGVYISGRERPDPYLLPIVVAVSILAVLFVAVLWLFPKTIARGLLPLSSDVPAPPSSPEIWIAVGSSLIGLWLVASAVPALMRNSLVMYMFRSEAMDMSGLRSGLLYYFIQFVVGAGLIFGASAIKRFIVWARHAGPK